MHFFLNALRVNQLKAKQQIIHKQKTATAAFSRPKYILSVKSSPLIMYLLKLINWLVSMEASSRLFSLFFATVTQSVYHQESKSLTNQPMFRCNSWVMNMHLELLHNYSRKTGYQVVPKPLKCRYKIQVGNIFKFCCWIKRPNKAWFSCESPTAVMWIF